MLKQAIEDASDDDLKGALSDVSRTIMQLTITLLVLAAFAMAVVGTPDSQLILTDVPMSVPIVGRMPTEVALVIGPVLLVFVRFYLQLYINHWRQLDRARASRNVQRPIIISPMRDGLLRAGATAIRYALVPLALAAITFKALGTPGVLSFVLICTTVFVTILHLLQDLPPKWWLWAPIIAVSTLGVGLITERGQEFLPEAAADVLPAPDEVRRNLNLRYADLSDRVLEGRDLRGADLRKAKLMNSDLSQIEFEDTEREPIRTNLSGANLDEADLSNADLKGAILINTELYSATLASTNLFGADLSDANLAHAKLTNAYVSDADLNNAYLRNADLSGANLVGANLTEAKLGAADLTDANLTAADLANVYLFGADLIGAIFESANLAYAKLDDANLTGANLRYANLTKASLGYADLTDTDLNSADLSNAILFRVTANNADLTETSLAKAFLRFAILTNANFDRANLTGADLVGADVTNASFRFADLTNAYLLSLPTLTCYQLTSAIGWESAYRDEEMACGAEIPGPPNCEGC